MNPTLEPEKRPETTPGHAPVPAWFWCVAVALVFIGALYLGLNSGGFKSDVYNPAQVSWAGGGGAVAAAPDPKEIGKRIFTANCVVCHQANGEGVAGQFPSLVGSEWVLAQEWHGDNHLVNVLLDGLQGPIQVKGQPFNGAMPPWKHLKDTEIAGVLTYIRSEWGNDAPPIPVEYVTKAREAHADRAEPWTREELEALGRELVSEADSAPATGDAAPAGGGGSAAAEVTPEVLAKGKKVFAMNCVVCHQATGEGIPGAFPPLVGSEWVLSEGWEGDSHLPAIVIHGLQGEVQVKGATYNSVMAPLAHLKDDEISAVLTYVRNEWGNSAPAISTELVTKVREASADRALPWTTDELRQFEKELSGGGADAPPSEP